MHFYVNIRSKGLSVKFIRGHLAAISFWVKGEGMPDCTSELWIRKMPEGWNRESRRTSDDWHPISTQVLGWLLKVFNSICKSSYGASLFYAAALLAFFFHISY